MFATKNIITTVVKEIKYREFDSFQKQAVNLTEFHLIAFATACCERSYSHIAHFLNEIKNEDDWRGEDVWRVALDEIWKMLNNREIITMQIEKILENCQENYPEDHDGENHAQFERSVQAIYYLLELCTLSKKNQIEYIVTLLDEIHEILFEYISSSMDEPTDMNNNLSHNELVNIVTNHDLTVKEIQKENEDLHSLRESPAITQELLQWLRTSSAIN